MMKINKISSSNAIVSKHSIALHCAVKVQLFWEGHNKLLNLPHGFDVY